MARIWPSLLLLLLVPGRSVAQDMPSDAVLVEVGGAGFAEFYQIPVAAFRRLGSTDASRLSRLVNGSNDTLRARYLRSRHDLALFIENFDYYVIPICAGPPRLPAPRRIQRRQSVLTIKCPG